MADDVVIPPAAPTTIATDDVGGGRQVQLVKIVDARNGGTNALTVTASGAMDTGQPFLLAANAVADALQPSYTSGKLFGGVLDLVDNVAVGLYHIEQIIVADLSGAALPAIDLVLYCDSDTPPITATADGDAFTSSGFSVTAAIGLKVASADLVAGGHPFFPTAGVYRPATPVPWRVANYDHLGFAQVDVKAVLVTTGSIASPTGGPFAIAVTARQVGASPAA